MRPRAIGIGAALLALAGAGGAWGAGTLAGTDIANQATVSYSVGPSAFTQASNVVTTRVAELLDHSVVWQDAGNVPVTPGAAGRVLTFRLANTGNGSDTYSLLVTNALGGDDFDPTAAGVHLDGNGNGTYEAGVDPLYVPGTNDPTLAADAFLAVFVLSDIPGGAGDGQLGDSRLTASSQTGTGAPGTVVAGAGEGGTDAVVGTAGGTGAVVGTYQVSAAVVSAVKSATVTDPFGGAEPVPGAVIRYTIAVSAVGAGTATGVAVADPIPANTTYRAGTLTLNGAPLTDVPDADAGDVGATAPGAVTVGLGDLTGASPVQTITFEVSID